MNPKSPMETLNQATARLERDGYVHAFRPIRGGALEVDGHGPPIEPESLVVTEVVRFEGESDPEDAAILFALRNADGSLCGTFAAPFGAQIEAAPAEAIQRLRAAERQPKA